MSEIYIKVGKDDIVTMLHRCPLDPKNGLGKTREELEAEGFFYNGEEPKPQMMHGRTPVLKYDSVEKKLYYVYKIRPVSMAERVDSIENVINEAIMSGKL